MANKQKTGKGRTINLSQMDDHFDDDTMASAINAVLKDADDAISKYDDKKAPEEVSVDEAAEEIEIDEEVIIVEEEIEAVTEQNAQAAKSTKEETDKTEQEETNSEKPEKSAKPDGLAELPDQPDEEEDAAEDKPQVDYYERLLRVMAEFENYKKRAIKERNEFKRFAVENTISNFLPVLDNFERALDHMDADVPPAVLDGIKMIFRQLNEILKNEGVRTFESVGKIFDPAKHQAMQMRPTRKVEANTIIEEFQRGYFLHERLIRPAMVVVAEKPADDFVEESENSEDAGLPSLSDENIETEIFEEVEILEESDAEIIEDVEELEEQDEIIEDLEIIEE